MANNFRYNNPIRVCTKSFKNYRSYKKYLADDFNSRCGYTDCSDFWFGGINTFHIDHFKPFSKNPNLKTDYSNLVYCCSYVNILKSNDEGNYLDPCDVDYNNHFERDNNGFIIPKSTSIEASYMFNKLKLGLKRYAIIWKLDNLLERAYKLEVLIDKESNLELKNELHIFHSKLSIVIHSYLRKLKQNQ